MVSCLETRGYESFTQCPYERYMGNSPALSVASILVGAASLGAILGIGSLVATPQGRSAVAAKGTDIAIATGIKRAREPQAGDSWNGCDDARAAGTAPIYRGEPGYRSGMDGDDDGVACESVRGYVGSGHYGSGRWRPRFRR